MRTCALYNPSNGTTRSRAEPSGGANDLGTRGANVTEFAPVACSSLPKRRLVHHSPTVVALLVTLLHRSPEAAGISIVRKFEDFVCRLIAAKLRCDGDTQTA